MADITINLGGELVDLDKSIDQFAVKKRIGGVPGQLDAVHAYADQLQQLTFNKSHSVADVEVYSLEAESRDDAMTLLRKHGTDVQWCSHVYHVPGDPQGLMVPTDTIYVELDSDVSEEAFNGLLDEFSLELVSEDDSEPNALILRLTSAATQNPLKIANALLATSHVKLAEPDFAVELSFKAHRPTDDLFPSQWHLENRGGFGLTAGAHVGAPDAWDITRGDPSIVTCVMDDGVDLQHRDFSSPNKIVAPRDFGQEDNDPSPVRNGRGARGDNHGTSCAGVAVAGENGIGTVGIAPNCRLMPVRTSGMISSQTIENLFAHARTHGADVISCSWGVAAEFFTLTTRMKRAIARAATEGRDGKGCVIVFAAGNENRPVDGSVDGRNFRAGFAIHPDVIAVSASNSRDRRSHYSNFGPPIWVSAPSSGRGGRGIITTDRTGDVGYQEGDYTTVDTFGGTSSSTPLVAGICALILSVNPELTASDVKDILKQTSKKIDADGGRYSADGHSEFYGWGRVDAHRAVQEAQDRVRPPAATRTRTVERSPALAIPDNNTVGIRDVIEIADATDVVSIGVSVAIRHTYRGDLIVNLVGPDGTTVLLHERTGGTRDDLNTEFTLSNTPTLAAFHGESAAGSWELHVRDLAPVDVGTLDGWALTLGLAGSGRTEWVAAPGLAIPDDDPAGITNEIHVDGAGQLREIELTVDITHSYRGDLRVSLEAPSGLSAPVHSRTGFERDNLRRTYTASDTVALRALIDSRVNINGPWRLHVADHAPVDLGKLNSWKLKLIA